MYTFLSALFGCKFRPMENATAYWTHLRKCFEAGRDGKRFVDKKTAGRAVKICSKAYLLDELRAVKPELVVAVGGSVKDYFYDVSKDRRLKGGITEIFMRNIIKNVRVGNLEFDLAVVPHPSGQNNWLWQEINIYGSRKKSLKEWGANT